MRTILFLPYFGKFPNYFQLYLQSCKYKRNFDWLIITDDLTIYEYPDNVKVVIKTFAEIKEYIQSKFDFEISLEKPYKLCDYRPAFGYIFQDYFTGYDFWGAVDPDCIWGDLDKYVTDDMLNKFDKLFILGHLSIYRNTMQNNIVFMRPLNGVCRYVNVFKSSCNEEFDEAVGNNSINDIYRYYGIPIYEDKNRADIVSFLHTMRLSEYEGPNIKELIEPAKFRLFKWNRGKLYGITFTCMGMKKHLKEYSYLHFHGNKKMILKEINSWDHFYVSRNQFLDKKTAECSFFLLNQYIDYLLALFFDIYGLKYKDIAFLQSLKRLIKTYVLKC